MEPEIKKLWTDALRSGEYRQGKDWLCYETTSGECQYCCLGVLIDVACDGSWEYDPNKGHWSFQGEAENLTDRARKYFGLTHNENDTLVWMNDDRGRSFAKIADWIDSHL